MSATASFAVLGLPEGATDSEVEEAHAELVAYLELAPVALKEWAAGELAAADRAYAELLAHLPDTPEAEPAAPITKPSNGHATIKLRSQTSDLDALADSGDLFDGHVEPPTRKAQKKAAAKPKAEPTKAESWTGRRLSPAVRRLAIVVGALAVLAVVAFAGYQLGNPAVPGINGTPAPDASGAVLDPAQVSALMQKIQANPQDVDALSELADLYYAAGDYETAGLWLDKVIAVDPSNVAALLGRGAVAYNTGDNDTAERSWRAVLAVDDTNVEAHYDLGFMYFTQDPPKSDEARAEWNRVVELVPDSEIANTVRTHLGQLEPSASPGASSTPAPSASPVGGTN